MIGKLTTIMVVVKDMERSKKFYGGVLGMKQQFDSAEWAQFDAGNVAVGVHKESERLHVQPHEGMQFAFEVRDIQQSAAELKKKGVSFVREPQQESFGWLAVFKDPDGHHIQLVQRAA